MSETGYCDRCGRPLDATAGDRDAGEDHAACRAARRYEPPRYCVHCGRRTVVQVTPGGWSSRCARHGLTTSPG